MNDNNLILKSFSAMGTVEAFNNLQKKNEDMLTLLNDESSYMELPYQSVFSTINYSGDDNLEKALLAFRDIWYLEEEDGRSTRSYQGVIMGTEKLIDAVHSLNEAKDLFHVAIKYHTGDSKAALMDFKDEVKASHIKRQKLNSLGISRLNLNSCYRHVPVLDEVPVKIGYSLMSNGKSIKKITPEQAIAKLRRLNKTEPDHIKIQIKKLLALPSDTILAQIQKQSPIIKANIVFLDRKETPPKRTMLTRKPPLPIFIPQGPVPTINFINSDFSPNSRLERLDRTIEEDVFIPSLRIHKYI